MIIIIYLIYLVSILIKEVSTTSAIVTQFSSLIYPNSDNNFPLCDGGKGYCVCNHCSVCLYIRLIYEYNFNSNVQIASFPAGSKQEISLDSPSVTKTVRDVHRDANQIRFFANRCEDGSSAIRMEFFFDFFIDNNFFIKCNYCIGSYRSYQVKGTISVSDMNLMSIKGFKTDISKIKFLSQRYNPNNQCCYSNYDNKFDGCNSCTFYIALYINERTANTERLDYLSSWIPDRSYSITLIIALQYEITNPLNLTILIYQDRKSELIDAFRNIRGISLPYNKREYNLIGEYKRVQLVFKMSAISIQRNGGNSQYTPFNLAEGANMDLNGNVKCADPIISSPTCDRNRDISFCRINSPCQNGGKCNGTKTAYNCECPSGYIGKNCQLYYCSKPCVNSQCAGPNTCGKCNAGWAGNTCEEKTCTDYKKCVNGVCVINGRIRSCICNGTAAGNFCQFKCSFSCNNGVCVYANGINFCYCKVGWYGSICNRQTVDEEKIYYQSKNFIIAIVLIIIIGLIIIIATYIFMTKYFNTHVKTNIHEGDITQYRSTIHATNTPNNANFELLDNSKDEPEPKEYFMGSDYKAANFYNDKNIYTSDTKKVIADDTVYFNPYSDIQAQETYNYGLHQDVEAYTAVSYKNQNKSKQPKKGKEENNINKISENPYEDTKENPNEIYKSDIVKKSENKTSYNNDYDNAYQNPYDN